jgi:hypothetical protein
MTTMPNTFYDVFFYSAIRGLFVKGALVTLGGLSYVVECILGFVVGIIQTIPLTIGVLSKKLLQLCALAA